VLSIQPTGNTSIVANIVSGGIEPIFAPEYIRTSILHETPDHISDKTPPWYEGGFYETEMFKFTIEGDEKILRGVDEFGDVYKIDQNRGLTRETLIEDYAVRYLKDRGEWDPNADYVVTALQLSVQQHLDDLKGFARWIDSAISKTINVPYDYDYKDFEDVYLDAYTSGVIKGITTYRSGTMTSVLSENSKTNRASDIQEIILDDVRVPDSATAEMKTIRSEGKKWYVTVIYDESNTMPIALFVSTNAHEKSVTTNNAVDILCELAYSKGIPSPHIGKTLSKIRMDNNATKLTRMISLLLRHGVLIRNVVNALDKVDGVYAGTFVFAIKKFLSNYIKDGETIDGESCAECGGVLEYKEGCMVCRDCGSSKCS
jgi:ribonucleoside-diphosphate reductase alpha chain